MPGFVGIAGRRRLSISHERITELVLEMPEFYDEDLSVPRVVDAFLEKHEPHTISSTKIGRLRRVHGVRAKPKYYSLSKRGAEFRLKVRAHKDIGAPGQHTTVPSSQIARDCGCSITLVNQVRRQLNIPPYRKFSGELPELQGRNLTLSERRAYRVCRIAKHWPRPKGIDEHLEELSDRL